MYQNPSASVAVTGHSLGAALAVLSAAHLQSQEGINVDYLYTFGLPRVGDSAFSSWFNSIIPQAIHVTHYHDIVPHVPPEVKSPTFDNCMCYISVTNDCLHLRFSASTTRPRKYGTTQKRRYLTQFVMTVARILPVLTVLISLTFPSKTICIIWMSISRTVILVNEYVLALWCQWMSIATCIVFGSLVDNCLCSVLYMCVAKVVLAMSSFAKIICSGL